MAVIAVRGRDEVAAVERRHRADAGRFLPDVEVVVAGKDLVRAKTAHGLFEAPYQEHFLEELPALSAGIRRRGHIASVAANCVLAPIISPRTASAIRSGFG